MHDLVFNEQGNALMVYRDRGGQSLPWHREGTGISEPITLEQLIPLCGFGREISLVPACYWDNKAQEVKRIPERFAVTDDAGRCLGIVGAQYTVLQDYKVLTALRPLVDNLGYTVETAGMLRAGAQTWVQLGADLVADVRPGDAVRDYILAANAHDGSRVFELGNTRTRVVCSNTLAAARHEGKLARLRHSGDIEGKVDQLVAVYKHCFEQDIELWKAFAGKAVFQNTLDNFLDKYVGPKKEKGRAGKRERIVEAFESGTGNGGGTLWDLYNGVTEVITHKGNDGQGAAKALRSTWFGAGAKNIQRASNIITSML